MSHQILLILHLLAATAWLGGHLVLVLGYLPEAIRSRDPRALLDNYQRLNRVALPALVVVIVTGLWLALNWMPDVGLWFDTSLPIAVVILAKLALLMLTLLLVAYLRLRVLTTLTPSRIPRLGLVFTLLALLATVAAAIGSSFRYGGFV